MWKRLAWLPLFLVSCVRPVAQGGSNGNDRTTGGDQGEPLLTGAMIISPDGKYVISQRNQTSVLLDAAQKVAREMPDQVDRFIFSKDVLFGIAILKDDMSVVRYDLMGAKQLWRTAPPFSSSSGARLARLTDDGKTLVLGDEDRLLVLDAGNGQLTGTIPLPSAPSELAFLPGMRQALVVGTTQWTNHQPLTDVIDVDFDSLAAHAISVPNCAAPIVVLPDGSRAFMSPTFCQEDQASNPSQTWTNPDPVSVIDLSAEGPEFLKNLPGFGPVALDPTATRAVAYLDVQRMDESMFDDKTKVPSRSGARYHIMTIDPASLAYELAPIGDLLPRFAMTRSGASLLVDATVQRTRGEVDVKATVDSSGRLMVNVKVFGNTSSLFGTFDLATGSYAPFSGPAASLDRFVQMGDGSRVFTLKLTSDGLGGDLYRIDLDGKTAMSLGKSLRDIGLLDQKTILLRQRLPAVQVQTSAGSSWYRRETYCATLDGITCLWSVDFQDSKPFQTGPTCTSYHDC